MNRELVLYNLAYNIAANAHEGQKYGENEDYIWHPVRVSQRVNTIEEKIVALLHDVLEDTDYIDVSLISQIFGVNVAVAVSQLTRIKGGETYVEFIERVANSPLATRVKIADLEDNLSHNPKKSLIERYENALTYLNKFT